jgi:CRISPR-associated protein Cas1
MEQLTDLKAILHSKRANIYYLEKCRVMQKDGRVLYLTESKDENLYWNIPIANTTVILLGNGTSITQAAVRMLAAAGVLIGFSGGGGTPLLVGTEIEWLTPQSEYRPTDYIQGWLSFWFDDGKRLNVAKTFQHARVNYLQRVWEKDRELKAENFFVDDSALCSALDNYAKQIETAVKTGDLLQREALLTKQLYRYAAKTTQLGEFVREREATDLANGFLNHGNYLAYGLPPPPFGYLASRTVSPSCTAKPAGAP